MGDVWIAEHQMLARPAAIKLIRPEALGAHEAGSHVVEERFKREAQATAALRSTHTVELYDFGVTDDGAFYYVIRQVCHSLGEAHEHGLVHRDIKPANIFTCRLGPDLDFVKVLDFGLVKATGEKSGGATALTREGVVAGTPAFMAPELALGTEVDGRSDIYALGCLAYWLLTAQPVFEGDTPVATLLRHVQEEPIPPSRRTEISIPADLETIVMACLAKEPADRPQTAGELDARLAECSVGPWTGEQAEEWWKLHGADYGSSGGAPPSS